MTVRRLRLSGFAAALLALACVNVGTQVQEFSVASGPNGAMANIQTESGAISGELLAVQEDGVIVLDNSVMELVPYHFIRSLRLRQLDGDYALGSDAPDRARRARLASVSRYPQGINVQLRQRLLAQLRQSEIVVAR